MGTVPSWAIATTAAVFVFAAGRAISAQDKYTLQVPEGLAFSEFRGYEDWPTVAVSQTENTIEVIHANPEMIAAHRAGAAGNGEPFLDGSKMAKIHWTVKKCGSPPLRRRCRTLCMTSISC